MLGVFAGPVAAVVILVLIGLPSRMTTAGGAGGSTGLGGVFMLMGVTFYGALGGFLLGLAIPLLYHGWKVRTFGSALGAVAGAGAGVLWLATIVRSQSGADLLASIVAGLYFAFFGAVVGFLLGFVIPVIWHGWKLRTAARQRSKNPVKLAELGPLGEGSGASSSQA